MSRGRQGANWCLFATAALLLLVAATSTAAAKAGPAAGAAGSGSPLLAAVDVGLGAGQDLDVAGVELALEAPRSWTYLADLARFVEDATWRLEMDVQGLVGGCLEPSARLKTRVRGYQLFRGGNKAGGFSLIPYAARDCDSSRTAGHVGGVFTTTDPLGYVDGPNLYQFALNNPVNFSDPMGLYVGETDPAKIQAQQLEAQRTAQAQDAERWRRFGEKVSLEQDLFDSHVRYNGLDFWSAEEQKQYAYQYFQFRRGMNNEDASAFSGYLAGPVECDPTQPHCRHNWEALRTGVTVMEAGVGISLAVFDPALLMGGGGGVNIAAYRSGLGPRYAALRNIHGQNLNMYRQAGINPMRTFRLRRSMQQSPIGRRVLEAADNHIIELEITGSRIADRGLLGETFGRNAYVYTFNTQSYSRTAEIAIHEGIHALGVGGSRRAEALARLAEISHRGGAIDRAAMRRVLMDMRGNYDHLRWRTGGTSPHFPGLSF